MAAICVDSIFVIFYKFDFPGSRNLFLKLLPRIQSLGCPWTTSTTLTSTRNGPFNCENTRSHFYLWQNVLKPGASTNVQKRAVLRCLLVQKWRRDIDFDVFQVKSRPKVKFMWISWKLPWTKRPIIIILRECHNIWLVNSKSEIKINTQNQPGVKSTDHKHQSHILITSLTMKLFSQIKILIMPLTAYCVYTSWHISTATLKASCPRLTWMSQVGRGTWLDTTLHECMRQSVMASLATTPVRWSA